jgi:polysaccharide export outer membrane protein
MPPNLFKALAFPSFPGIKGGERDSLAAPPPAGSLRLRSAALIFIGLGLLGGCVGPSPPVLPPPALSQLQTMRPNQGLPPQLMLQATKASLASYKDYQVGPEDLLDIEIFGQEKLDRVVRVNGQGEITMPLVGVVQVAHLSPQEIEKRLMALYDARFLVNPQVTVEVKEFRHQRVMVSGAVTAPGSYEVIGPRTLLEMLGKAGGLTEKAGDMVHVIRQQNAPDLTKAMKTGAPTHSLAPGDEIVVIDLRRLLQGGAPDFNLAIKNGDIIHVPYAQMAFVLGAVKKPGQVPIKDNLTVTQAIAITEGLDPMLSSNRVTVLRFDEQGHRLTLPAPARKNGMVAAVHVFRLRWKPVYVIYYFILVNAAILLGFFKNVLGMQKTAWESTRR